MASVVVVLTAAVAAVGSAGVERSAPPVGRFTGAAAVPGGALGYMFWVTPNLSGGGGVGWCFWDRVLDRFGGGGGGGCWPPLKGSPIVAADAGGGGTQASNHTEVAFMTTSQVAAVRVSPKLTIQTRADPQLPEGYRIAIAITQTAGRGRGDGAQFPDPRGAVALNRQGRPFGRALTYVQVHDSSVYWQPHPTNGVGPQPKVHVPPAAACEIDTRALHGVDLFFGWVVPHITGFSQLAGRPFLTCAISEFGYDHAGVIAALLLDAREPGTAPAPFPDATAVEGHPNTVNQPALAPPTGLRAPDGDFAITGRRIGDAWLVVQAGGTLAYRIGVLDQLNACVHITGPACPAEK